MRVGLAQMLDIQRLTKTEIGAQKNPPTEITARGLERNFYLLFIISQFIIYNYLLINIMDMTIMVSICNVINMFSIYLLSGNDLL